MTPLRVLVVEDDVQLLGYLSYLLAGWGYRVEPARSGTDALACCQRQCPDVVISDFVMPGMSGLELLHALKEVKGCEGIYFVLITGNGTISDAVRAIMEGAHEVLVKPLKDMELLGMLQRYEAKLRAKESAT